MNQNYQLNDDQNYNHSYEPRQSKSKDQSFLKKTLSIKNSQIFSYQQTGSKTKVPRFYPDTAAHLGTFPFEQHYKEEAEE
jgi:hypothetical protein